METLASSLRLTRDVLPAALVKPHAAAALEQLAARLAPIHCAGFEIRLAEGDDTVDLIQRVRVTRGEPRLLLRHIEEAGLGDEPAWARVAAYCRAWSNPDGLLHRMVLTTFLGFDAAAASDPLPQPSLYLSLEPGCTRRCAALLELIDDAAALLEVPVSAQTRDAVSACHEALPPGAAIADVGFMLAREVDAVRLVAAHVPRDEIAAYLQALPWAGTAPDVATAEPLIPPSLRHVMLSLDVGARLAPRVGLEYDPGHRDHDLPVWREALATLQRAGLCAGAARDALPAWAGHLEPTDSAAPWPAGLLIESLLNRSDQFLVLARRLTFLKLVCEAGGALHAKAYFGYGPRSFAPAHPASEPAPPGARGRAQGRRAAAVDAGTEVFLVDAPVAAIRSAVDFMLARRQPDGLWLEYPRILAGSDEWVTAYIATVLAGLDHPDARAAAQAAWQVLCERRSQDGGWGYNGELPIDADSTLWGLRLADALDAPGDERVAHARAALARHRLPDGGVATYAAGAEAGLRALLGAGDLHGMFVSHACVSAAAAVPAALGAEVLPWLLAAQKSDGRWRGYWWSDDEYTTALAVDALRHAHGERARRAVAAAQRWVRGRFDRNNVVWSRGMAAPSVFATALCTGMLAGPPRHDDDADRVLAGALRWLLGEQQADGGWPASALMQMPPPDAEDGAQRPEANTVSADEHRLLTTATVARTLATLGQATGR